MAEKPWSWFITCLLWTGPAFGISVVPNIDCPTQFRAIASEVREPQGPESNFSKQTIVFQVEELLKGSIESSVEVELLKFGPLEVEAGKEYLVQLNKGKLCWLESVE